MTDTITKKDFQAYLKVQRSGATNMFDIRKVEQLSGLPRPKVLLIMSHYAEYKERWSATK